MINLTTTFNNNIRIAIIPTTNSIIITRNLITTMNYFYYCLYYCILLYIIVNCLVSKTFYLYIVRLSIKSRRKSVELH